MKAGTWSALVALVLALGALSGCGGGGEQSAGTGSAPAPGGNTGAASAPGGAAAAGKKWVIGFSQATTAEPWRKVFNEQLQAEAAKHPDVELIIQDAQDKTENQVQQMESLITRKVNAILISPKESAGPSRAVAQATDQGIPVFVLDRNVDTDKYACFIGADNVEIGRQAGRHAVKLLGGEGKAKGSYVEVWGGFGTKPSADRSKGFHEIVDREPGMKLVGTKTDCDWKLEKSQNYMEAVLKLYPQIDLVYAHNDPMAKGARQAAEKVGRAEKIQFLGIDGLPNEGVQWVKQGLLAATFLYPTPGAEGLRQALKKLNGESVEKKITLPTATITKENAAQYEK
jgi:ribose transport system substrate-binding protein